MSPHGHYLLAWFATIAIGLGIGISALYLSGWLMLLAVAWLLFAQAWIRRIACPQCDTPLSFDGHHLRDRVGTPLILNKVKCAACGRDLTQP